MLDLGSADIRTYVDEAAALRVVRRLRRGLAITGILCIAFVGVIVYLIYDREHSRRQELQTRVDTLQLENSALKESLSTKLQIAIDLRNAFAPLKADLQQVAGAVNTLQTTSKDLESAGDDFGGLLTKMSAPSEIAENSKLLSNRVSRINTAVTDFDDRLAKWISDPPLPPPQPAPVRPATVSSESKANDRRGQTVYVTNTGSKYHRASCSYLRKSSNPLKLSEAIADGYSACSRCSP